MIQNGRAGFAFAEKERRPAADGDSVGDADLNERQRKLVDPQVGLPALERPAGWPEEQACLVGIGGFEFARR